MKRMGLLCRMGLHAWTKGERSGLTMQYRCLACGLKRGRSLL